MFSGEEARRDMQLSHHVPGVAAWLRTVEGVTISPTLDPVQFRLRESHSTLANHIEEVSGAISSMTGLPPSLPHSYSGNFPNLDPHGRQSKGSSM